LNVFSWKIRVFTIPPAADKKDPASRAAIALVLRFADRTINKSMNLELGRQQAAVDAELRCERVVRLAQASKSSICVGRD
jgi:hypothetical protein